jgi:stearoyl-CoA desaturase (delta-9 desaturase)
MLIHSTLRRYSALSYSQTLPFILFHLATLISVFWFPPTLPLIALCLATYTIRMFGVTAGYHRYFAHRSFKTGRVFQLILAFLAQSSAQQGVLWWAAHHRHHHKFSDHPEDLHSPLQSGFWWSHLGWIFARDHLPTRFELIRDFEKYAELRFLNRYPLIPIILMGIALFIIGGTPWLVWGLGVSTVFLWHGTFTINSLSHVFGTRRFRTSDTSRNNPLLALITLGEGWHNNHHRYPSSTRQGFYWWEFDITYWVLKGLRLIGLVSDLRSPPRQIYEEAAISRRPLILSNQSR